MCAPTDGLGACGVAPERWAGLMMREERAPCPCGVGQVDWGMRVGGARCGCNETGLARGSRTGQRFNVNVAHMRIIGDRALRTTHTHHTIKYSAPSVLIGLHSDGPVVILGGCDGAGAASPPHAAPGFAPVQYVRFSFSSRAFPRRSRSTRDTRDGRELHISF